MDLVKIWITICYVSFFFNSSSMVGWFSWHCIFKSVCISFYLNCDTIFKKFWLQNAHKNIFSFQLEVFLRAVSSTMLPWERYHRSTRAYQKRRKISPLLPTAMTTTWIILEALLPSEMTGAYSPFCRGKFTRDDLFRLQFRWFSAWFGITTSHSPDSNSFCTFNTSRTSTTWTSPTWGTASSIWSDHSYKERRREFCSCSSRCQRVER